MNTLILIFFVIAWLILITASWAGISAAPWVPSKKNQQALLRKNLIIPNGSTVFDLGCGTGTLLFSSAKHQPNAKYIGIELSALPYLIAKIRSFFYKNVQIKFGNLFNKDLSEADIIFVFLLEKAYKKLSKKFANELKDECLVAFEVWPCKEITSYKVVHEANILPLYLYKGSKFR